MYVFCRLLSSIYEQKTLKIYVCTTEIYLNSFSKLIFLLKYTCFMTTTSKVEGTHVNF